MTHENRRIRQDLKRKKAKKRLNKLSAHQHEKTYRNLIGFQPAQTGKKREKNGARKLHEFRYKVVKEYYVIKADVIKIG